MIETGTYHPNQAGAKTLRDARPLMVGRKRITVNVSENEATLFIGGDIGATAERSRFASHVELVEWAREVVAGETAPAERKIVTNEYGLKVEIAAASDFEEVPVEKIAQGDLVYVERFGTWHPVTYWRHEKRRNGLLETVLLVAAGNHYFKPGETVRRHRDPKGYQHRAWLRKPRV
jgi:hypothetical protein